MNLKKTFTLLRGTWVPYFNLITLLNLNTFNLDSDNNTHWEYKGSCLSTLNVINS